MVRQKNIYKIVAVLAILLAATYIPVFMNQQVIDAFTKEDRIYEVLTAAYFLVASSMFAIAFFRSRARFSLKDPAWLKKISHLGFALLFLVAALEEISWGQRIFNFATPAALSDVNAQSEFTLHNLKIFQGEKAPIPMDFNQLSAAFALFFGLLVPLISLVFKPLKQFVTARFPVMPVQFSILFALNYAFQKILVRLLPAVPDLYQGSVRAAVPVYEVREHDYGLLLMISAIFYVLLRLDTSQEPQFASPNNVKTEFGKEIT